MNERDPCIDCSDDVLAVYLIVNGSLEMSAGKIASQSFQAAQRLIKASQNGAKPKYKQLIADWEKQGTRTITRIALTQILFDRACRELDGVTMVDEGLTEVPPDSTTVLATWPLRRSKLPRMLRHRRIPLLTSKIS